jgi:hypothetical protein
MSALPVGYALEGIRLLPARLAGRKHQSLAGRTFLDVTPIPVLFSERPEVVISAGLSQAWRLLGGQTPPRLDAAALRAWSQPGWIKVAMEFRFEPIPAGTLLSTETRILATDPGTRRSFAAYWFLIRPSSSAIRREVLAVVARRAELSRSQNINCACRKPHLRHATRLYSLIRQAVWACRRTRYRSRSAGSGRGFSGAAAFRERCGRC